MESPIEQTPLEQLSHRNGQVTALHRRTLVDPPLSRPQ